ncbi:MAG: VCBS repeat-containing protein [Lewinella sp.]|nr:VCBS repeat-containing protein [Lewinella sp.]
MKYLLRRSIFLLFLLFPLILSAQWTPLGGGTDYSFEQNDLYTISYLGKIYRSENMGNDWQQVQTNYVPISEDVEHFTVLGDLFYVITSANNVWYSEDNGNTWTKITGGDRPFDPLRFLKIAGKVYVVNDSSTKLYTPSEDHSEWISISTPIFVANCYTANDTAVYVGSRSGGVYYARYDDLENWHQINDGLPSRFFPPVYDDIMTITTNGTDLYAIIERNGLYKWSPEEKHWQLLDALPFTPSSSADIISVVAFGEQLLVNVENYGESFLSSDGGATFSLYEPRQRGHFFRFGDFVFSWDNNSLLRHPAAGLFYEKATRSTLGMSPVWERTITGEYLGEGGFFAKDLDLDGRKEILCSGKNGNDYWFSIYEYDSQQQTYIKSFVSDAFVGRKIIDIQPIDLDGDQRYELAIGFDDSWLELYDSEHYDSMLYAIQMPARPAPAGDRYKISNFIIEDIDQNGTREFITLTQNNIIALDIDDGSVVYEFPYSGTALAYGNVDADPANELVLNTGYVLEFRQDSLLLEWDYPNGYFSAYRQSLLLRDIDSDGIKEIIGLAAGTTNDIEVFSVPDQARIYTIDAYYPEFSFELWDDDGDGWMEVFVPNWTGRHILYDLRTGTEIREFDIGGGDSHDVLIEDVDSDGNMEILLADGNSSTASDHILIFDRATFAEEWQSDFVSLYRYEMAIGDVDGDCTPEMIFLEEYDSLPPSDFNRIRELKLTAMNLETKEVKWQETIASGYPVDYPYIEVVKVSPITLGGPPKILIGGSERQDGFLKIYDPIQDIIENTYYFPNTNRIITIEVADLDQNNELEIILGSKATTSGLIDEIYVVNATDGHEIWASGDLGPGSSPGIYELMVEDVNNDTYPDIIANDYDIYVYSGLTKEPIFFLEEYEFSKPRFISTLKLNGKQHLVITEKNRIIVYNDQLTGIQEKIFMEDPVETIQIGDIDGNQMPDIVYGSEGSIKAFELASDGTLTNTYVSKPVSSSLELTRIGDFDGDGKVEIFVRSNQGFHEFENEIENDVAICLGADAAIDGEGLIPTPHPVTRHQWTVANQGNTNISNSHLINAQTSRLQINPNGLTPGTAVLRYTINTLDGCQLMRLVSITIPPTLTPVPAGMDQLDLCAPQTQLAAASPAEGFGLWKLLSGTNTGLISDPLDPNSLFHGRIGESYQLKWEIQQLTCPPPAQEVTIHFSDDSDADGIADACDCNAADPADAYQLISDSPIPGGAYYNVYDFEVNGSVAQNTQVDVIATHSVRLTAGFHARAGSAFSARIDDCQPPLPAPDLPAFRKETVAAPSLKIYPNPVSGNATIDMDLPKGDTIDLFVQNVNGQLVSILYKGERLDAGLYNRALPTANFAPGIYFLKYRTSTAIRTIKFIVVRK